MHRLETGGASGLIPAEKQRSHRSVRERAGSARCADEALLGPGGEAFGACAGSSHHGCVGGWVAAEVRKKKKSLEASMNE